MISETASTAMTMPTAERPLAYQILKGMRMPLEDILVIVTAIGHHDESTGTAVDVVSAALILADKTDVRRNRVQKSQHRQF